MENRVLVGETERPPHELPGFSCPRPVLDFVLVGAQKSGTTSLFRHLAAHPDIYMPPEKEIDFWIEDSKFARGTGWYLQEYFKDAPERCLRGEASTRYLTAGRVAGRLRESAPRVRILAILRNPIDRAYSHYRMAVRRRLERRSFEVSVRALLGRGPVPEELIDVERDFVLMGEYGRALAAYLAHFPRERMGVYFLDHLAADAPAFMKEIFTFLAMSSHVNLPNLRRRFHVGGEKRWAALERTAAWSVLKRGVRRWCPPQLRRSLGFWFETELNVKRETADRPQGRVRQLLASYYAEDVASLEAAFGLKVPWEDFR